MLAAALMKYLFVILALSVVAIVAAVVALLWRLRWHLKRPHIAPPNPMLESQPDHEPAERV